MKFCWVFPSMMVASLYVNPDNFRLGKFKIEKKFKKLNSNLNESELSVWPLTDTLTVELLEHICDNVLFHIFKTSVAKRRLDYLPPKTNDVKTERVIKNAKVYFDEDGMKNMTLIHCAYRMMDFFICKGDKKRVFRLEKDVDYWGNITYYFKSGSHPLTCTKSKRRTFS